MPSFARRPGRRRPRSRKPETLLDCGLPHLVDERSDPDFRTVYGVLARRAGSIDTAVARIRLTGLDLRPDELRSLDRIRVLLAEVNGIGLRSEAEAMLLDPHKADNLRNLVEMMGAGRIEVRSAPLAGWAPDFSVFHRKGRPWMLLAGLHWFARPFPDRGPALASLHGSGGATRTATRFSELWQRGHDIGPAILALLRGAQDRTESGRPGGVGRRAHPRRRARREKSPETSVAKGHSANRGQPDAS